MKKIAGILWGSFFCLAAMGQSAVSSYAFLDYQKSFPRIGDAMLRKEDSLIKQFREKNLEWPARYLYLRSFKYDSQLEVWVKSEKNEKFQLFKTYRVCAMSGSLGPKRMQGDYQVPEGFYYINEFNPKSTYHLSLGLNYPNASDRLLSDSLQPGGDIYIHGSCVTTGCIPITNEQIEELYILAAHARNAGQDFIPVHIFPVQFNNRKSTDYLNRYLRDYPEYRNLEDEMKQAYFYFEKTREIPVVMVNKMGQYRLEAEMPVAAKASDNNTPAKKKKPQRPMRHFDESEIAKVMDKAPEFPGGMERFQKFIDATCHEMAAYLESDQPKTYIMIEFYIDREGKPANAKVLKGGNEDLNARLEQKFDEMPAWKPAIRLDKTVVVRLRQSLYIEKTTP